MGFIILSYLFVIYKKWIGFAFVLVIIAIVAHNQLYIRRLAKESYLEITPDGTLKCKYYGRTEIDYPINEIKGTPIIRLVQQKTRNEVKIPIMNPNLEAICKKYEYNLSSVVDQILNRYIKEILKDLSEKVPTLAVKVPTKLTMKHVGAKCG